MLARPTGGGFTARFDRITLAETLSETLSHALSELTEFESNVRSRKTAGLRQSTGFCPQGSGLDKYLGQKICPVSLGLGVEGAFLVETEATAGKEMLRRISGHGGGVLNPERQSGRQSEGQSPLLLDSSR